MTKGPDAFRTISEAADEVGVPQHVLRFWETKFSFIRPMKRAGGRRFYRPADIAVLKGVRALLHDKGYTIKGAQKYYREEGTARVATLGNGDAPAAAQAESPIRSASPAATSATLRQVLAALETAKQALDAALQGR